MRQLNKLIIFNNSNIVRQKKLSKYTRDYAIKLLIVTLLYAIIVKWYLHSTG